MQSGSTDQADVLIVGAGLAGLFLALKLAPRRCIVMSPAPLGKAASSAWAQGGLAAALHPSDSPQQHAADTIAAGAGLVDPVVARLIAEDGSARVRDLIELGVPFDRTPDGALALSLEAAHSHPRVARVAGDLAGRAIMNALVGAVEASETITVVEGQRAVALLQSGSGAVTGVLAEDSNGRTERITVRETVLCTGGSGGLFDVTTNPKSAQGDALAMAARCGALIADAEFVQFHPTAMDVGLDPAPLATEALRGEGAILVNTSGERFMDRYHADGELAPRDEVARAIHRERLEGRGAFLDTRKAVGDAFPEHFPTVFKACEAAGIDPRQDLIPISPAAHYHMGGVVSDLWGRSTLDGLSVCGECASTGVHGANRLASNSLLEAVVFAARIAERIDGSALPELDKTGKASAPPNLPNDAMAELRVAMQTHCGVERNKAGLDRLGHTLEKLATSGWSNALKAAHLIWSSASARKESRGGHYRSDFPDMDTAGERSFNQVQIRQLEPQS